MAMDGTQLGNEIAAAIINQNAPADVKAKCIELWEKIGETIVSHIKKNAEVPAGIAVSTSGGNGATSAPGVIE